MERGGVRRIGAYEMEQRCLQEISAGKRRQSGRLGNSEQIVIFVQNVNDRGASGSIQGGRCQTSSDPLCKTVSGCAGLESMSTRPDECDHSHSVTEE